MKKLSLILVTVLVLTSLFMLSSQAAEPSGNTLYSSVEDGFIYNNVNTYEVTSKPRSETTFTLSEKAVISAIWTYHWELSEETFSGLYDAETHLLKPQTISIVATEENYTVYTGEVVTDIGQGGKADVNWYVFPDIELDAGTYRIVDSHNPSWSYNETSMNKGMCSVKGHAVDSSDGIAVSVIRSGSEEGVIRYMSDISGNAYYKVSTTNYAPSTDDMSAWDSLGPVTAGTTYRADLEGLAKGTKWLHIAVKETGGAMRTLKRTIIMPADIFILEDFEAYRTGTSTKNDIVPVNHITTAYYGAKISNDTDNKFLYLTGASGSNNYGDTLQQINLPAGINSSMTVELDFCSGENGGWFGITGAGSSPAVLAGISLGSPYLCTNSGGHDTFTTEIPRVIGEWHHIKFEIDLWTRCYDFYIDGVKQNVYPLSIKGNVQPERISFRASQARGDDTSRYDNLKVTVHDTSTQIDGHSVYRRSGTEATLYFAANQPGTFYYLVSDQPGVEFSPLVIMEGHTVENCQAGTNEISIDGLTPGPKYIHFFYRGIHGSDTRLDTVYLPYDLYYLDDFDSYMSDQYPGQLTTRYNRGSIQPALSGGGRNLAFRQHGSWGSYAEYHGNSYFTLPDYDEAKIVFSVDVTPVSEDPGSVYIGNNGSYNRQIAAIRILDSFFSTEDHTETRDVEYGRTYSYRIEYDTSLLTYDYYINGIKQNDTPKAAKNTNFKANCVEVYTGSGKYGNQVLLDNMEVSVISLGLDSVTRNGDDVSLTVTSPFDGTLCCLVNDSPLTPSLEDMETGASFTVTSGTNVVGLTADAPYIHIVAVNGIGSSNFITVAVPHEIYVFDRTTELSYPAQYEKVFDDEGIGIGGTAGAVLRATFISDDDPSEHSTDVLSLCIGKGAIIPSAGVRLINGNFVLADDASTVLASYTKGSTAEIEIVADFERMKYGIGINGNACAQDLDLVALPSGYRAEVSSFITGRFEKVEFFSLTEEETLHNYHLGYRVLNSISSQTVLEPDIYYLKNDVSVSGKSWYKAGAGTTICLNGHTILASQYTVPALHAENASSVLTVCDCTGTGVITAPAERSGAYYSCSALFIQNGGTINLNGGTVKNFYSAGGYLGGLGSGAWIENGTFNMSGGTITGNVCANNSGAGGVYVAANGSFNVSGKVVITGNYSCGGSGSHVHTGSCRASDVYLTTGKTVGIAGPLLDGTKIGIRTQTLPTAGNPVTITSGYSEACGDINPSGFFFSNDPAYIVKWNGDRTEAVLELHVHDFEYAVNGARVTATCRDADCPLHSASAITATIKPPVRTVFNGFGTNLASVAYSQEWIAAGLGTSYAVTYYKGVRMLDSAPENAGSYVARATFGEGESSVTARLSYTIEKKPLTIEMASFLIHGPFTADGSPVLPPVIVWDDEFMLAENVDYTLNYHICGNEGCHGDGALIGEGNYAVDIEGTPDGNYSGILLGDSYPSLQYDVIKTDYTGDPISGRLSVAPDSANGTRYSLINDTVWINLPDNFGIVNCLRGVYPVSEAWSLDINDLIVNGDLSSFADTSVVINISLQSNVYNTVENVRLTIAFENAKLTLKDGSDLTALDVPGTGMTVTSLEQKTTSAALKEEYESSEKIRIFKQDGVTELTDGEYVGTGCVVRLYSGETVTDEMEVVLMGDVNGDGLIKSADALIALKAGVGTVDIEDIFYYAGNLNHDSKITSAEALKILKFSVGTVSSLD